MWGWKILDDSSGRQECIWSRIHLFSSCFVIKFPVFFKTNITPVLSTDDSQYTNLMYIFDLNYFRNCDLLSHLRFNLDVLLLSKVAEFNKFLAPPLGLLLGLLL